MCDYTWRPASKLTRWMCDYIMKLWIETQFEVFDIRPFLFVFLVTCMVWASRVFRKWGSHRTSLNHCSTVWRSHERAKSRRPSQRPNHPLLRQPYVWSTTTRAIYSDMFGKKYNSVYVLHRRPEHHLCNLFRPLFFRIRFTLVKLLHKPLSIIVKLIKQFPQFCILHMDLNYYGDFLLARPAF